MRNYHRANQAEDGAGEEPLHRLHKPKKTALMYAVDLLARQEQSESKLREKLRHKGYEESETDLAIERLIAMHYLNDEEACARQFAFLYEESRSSVRQIVIKLRQRGFEASQVKACIPADIFEREKAAALRVLALKFRPAADRQKMMANLYSKGFESSAIRAAVEEFQRETEE